LGVEQSHGRDGIGRFSGLAYAGGRTGLLRREDQGAPRAPRRLARPGAARAGGRGADGLRRAPGARGPGRHRRRPGQPLPHVRFAAALLGIALAGLALAGTGARAADMIPEPLALIQGLDKINARVSQFEAPVGTSVRFGTLSVVVRDCQRSPPEERPENAAFVEVYETRPCENRTPLVSVWWFSSRPALAA